MSARLWSGVEPGVWYPWPEVAPPKSGLYIVVTKKHNMVDDMITAARYNRGNGKVPRGRPSAPWSKVLSGSVHVRAWMLLPEEIPPEFGKQERGEND